MLKVEDVDDLDELLHTNSQKPIKKKKKVDKKIAHTNVSTVSGSAKSNLKTPKGIKIPVNELNVETVKENVLQHDSIDDIHVSMEGIQDLQAALKDMEDKYNQLKNVGILEAEKRFDDFKAASDSQIKGWSLYLIVDYKIMVESLEDRIKILEKSKAAAVSTEDVELEMQAVKEQVRASLMEQMQVAESNWQSEKDSLVAMLQEVKESNENLMSEMERIKADMDVDIQGDTTRIKDGMLNLFQGLSGLSILNAEQNVSDENSFLYTCFIKGSRGALLFKISATLQMNGSSSVEYIPCLQMEFDGHQTSPDIIEHLPDYLTEEIEFGENMLSEFFLRMISYLNKLSE